MTSFSVILEKFDARIDAAANSLRGKKLRYCPSVAGAAVFFLLALGIFILMPSQIAVLPDQAITARTFPTALAAIMLAGAVFIGIRTAFKMIRKVPLETAELDLLTEVRALGILASLACFAVLMKTIGFIPSSVLFSFLMLRYFKVRSLEYHLIVAAAAVFIGVVFRYVLNVRLP